MRVQGPPPNRLVNQYMEGWNSASPDSASRMKVSAMIQWLVRSPGE